MLVTPSWIYAITAASIFFRFLSKRRLALMSPAALSKVIVSSFGGLALDDGSMFYWFVGLLLCEFPFIIFSLTLLCLCCFNTRAMVNCCSIFIKSEKIRNKELTCTNEG